MSGNFTKAIGCDAGERVQAKKSGGDCFMFNVLLLGGGTAFKAVCDYNDLAPSNDQRWFIGNVTLRDLSGCNGMLVKDWMDRHHQSIDFS